MVHSISRPAIDIPVAGKQLQPIISFARGFAILTIVLYHLLPKLPLPGLLQKAVSLGGSGIYVYFFVSAYGLAQSTKINWADFFLRRFSKVLLPYYAAVTCIFIVTLYVPIYRTEGWPEYLSHIFMYKMIDNTYTRNIDEYLWFIATIVQFYLLFPTLLWLTERVPMPWLLIFSIVVSLSYSLLITRMGVAYLRIYYSAVFQYLWLFVLGIAVARTTRRPLQFFTEQPGYVYVVAGGTGLLGVLGLDYWLGRMGSVFNDYFLFATYASFTILCYRLSRNQPILRVFIKWIESFSFALYLIHMPVFRLYTYLIRNNHAFEAVDLPFVLIFIFASAALFQRLIINNIPSVRVHNFRMRP